MAEYLVWRPDWLNDDEVTAQMIEMHKIMAPGFLASEVLPVARDYLVGTPGLHKEERKRLSENWLSWWIHYLQNKNLKEGKSELVNSDKIKQFSELEPWLARENQGKSSGVINFATGEGTEGHRAAVDWMRKFVKFPITLFESANYFDLHPRRRKPFLPLSVRLSLMAHYGVWVSQVPIKPKRISESVFYQKVFDRTGARFSFATENDPYLYEKIRRGEIAEFNVIPELLSPHTSERTKKFTNFEEEDMGLFNGMLGQNYGGEVRGIEVPIMDLDDILNIES